MLFVLLDLSHLNDIEFIELFLLSFKNYFVGLVVPGARCDLLKTKSPEDASGLFNFLYTPYQLGDRFLR